MKIINIKDNSNKLFYIGGVVRDELLGYNSVDIDITFVGNAIEYCSKFGKVIQENPDFGTVRVLILDDDKQNGEIVDFASTRFETYPKKGHLPVVEKIGCTLKEDVMRRDFTINALAKSVSTGKIVDYVGGLEDLKNKTLRILYDESFVDDPTRIIRGLKFSVRFGFELENNTRKLQEEYLSNINYDMSYKRIKKELMETFSKRNSCTTLQTEGILQLAFEKFINEKIYKLVTPNDVKLPDLNIEKLIIEYTKNLNYDISDTLWLIFVGVLKDLSRLPLTKLEQKILDDIPKANFKTDFEIYKAFENVNIETVLLYAILKDEKIARHYLDNLRNIRLEISGKDLQQLGFKPSPKYAEIFDKVLKEKLNNPKMTKKDEINLVKNLTF